MTRVTHSLVILALLSVLAWAPAVAQVRQIQGGSALDANYGLGSGGYNAPRPAQAINSQLIVTGQVTGLNRFQGNVGYFATDQLHLDLPSAQLQAFRRESVGVQDVVRGSTYQPSAYYDRSTTVFGVPGILSGDTAPGTNVPRQATVPPALANELYAGATSNYASIAVLKPQHMQATSPVVNPYGVLTFEGGSPTPQAGTTGEAEEGMTLQRFGVLKPGEQPPGGSQAVETRRNDQLNLKVDTAVNQRVPNPGSPSVPPLPEGAPKEKPSAPAGGRDVAEMLGQITYKADQDVFMDTLIRYNEALTGSALPNLKMAEAQPAEPGQRPLVEVVGNKVVIHSLAGRDGNMLNVGLAQAERKLRDGKYYEAAQAYVAASEIAPANPLPRVGEALAIFAAGEPSSAAVGLRRAMELLPPIMEMKVDLDKMFGRQVAVWEGRVAELDKRLEPLPAEAEPMLRFLAVYMHSQLGQAEGAKAQAVKLQAAAKSDRVLSIYASLVVTGKRPAEKAYVRPAPKPRTSPVPQTMPAPQSQPSKVSA